MAQDITVLTVSELNEYIGGKLETDKLLKNVTVKGQISNYKKHSTGHLYFSIKDEGSVIAAVMFRSSAKNLAFEPENDLSVIVTGRVCVYKPTGQYQIYVEKMQPDGIGSLALAFEQMKRKLSANGLFDKEHKKKLPKIPSVIGVVTSPTGAAVHDVINIATRRFPYAKIVLYPALVQGSGAAESVAEGIRWFNRTKSADVLIVGRGGGSIEDLWAFNEESLAYAVYRSEIPIISAVGHETDFTICDFVADMRAPTPSAAAELATPETGDLVRKFNNIVTKMLPCVMEPIQSYKMQLQLLSTSPAIRSPHTLIDEKKAQLSDLSKKLNGTFEKIVLQKKMTLSEKGAKLDALSPLKVFSRGYSAVYTGKRLVKKADDVGSGDKLKIVTSDGAIGATVD